MALHVHRAERTDQLADGLGEMLASPLPDPFAQEVVVVPERGIERWLAQRLSHRLGTGAGREDGVCAGVRFVRPASLVTRLLGRDDDDPWLPRQLAWPVLETIDASLGEPWCAALAQHLGHGLTGEEADVRAGRRYSVALRLAGLFHRYGVVRPQVLTDWRAGRDEDGAGRPLPADLCWQAELWRRVVARVDQPPPDERHTATLAALHEGRLEGLDLPDRLSLFGHTRLAVTEVELLAALGSHREVHLWLPQPSPVLWDRLARHDEHAGVVPRDEDTSAALVEHPLLASLGRDSRELIRVLTSVGGDALVDEGEAGPPPSRPATVLGWLQEDIRAGRAPSPDVVSGRTPADADRSIALHTAHGPARQVEVLREVLVGLLEDDPSLQPRDILVMCPDVETYAPLIGAAFGLGDHGTDAQGVDTHPAHRLRVRLADRALASTNPVLEVAARVIDLVGGRLRASEVLDLLAMPPVRRRFDLSDEDLSTITRWVGESGVRWGWDAERRAPFGLAKIDANTWRHGLDRLLLGVAVSADGPPSVAAVLPVDDVSSGEVDLVGRLAEVLDRLVAGLDALASAGTAREWTEALGRTVRGLVDVTPADGWQVTGLDRVLAEAAEHAPDDVPVRVADVRVLLSDRLEGRPTRASFRTGTLTVCTMVPMRSVPHRVICLLGLDDGAFPRQPTVDGDDVLARGPLTGERDARSEDRQLLLDAVMAATERLVVLWTGADERTGGRRPAAVPVGELVDAARETTRDPHVPEVVEHPLQPFDQRNLLPGALGEPGRPFTFDRSALAGARAALDLREPRPLVPAPLATPAATAGEAGEISLADLVAYFEHPARHFLRQRLGISLPRDAEELRDDIPVAPDALEVWQIGDRLLAARRGGTSAGDACLAEMLRGELPPGDLGQGLLTEIATTVEEVMAGLEQRTEGREGRSVDITAELLGSRRLTGTLDHVHGDHLVEATYSRVGAKHEIATWVRLLALTVATRRDETHRAVLLGRQSGVVLGPLLHETALAHLSRLVEVYELGQRLPLTLPPKTSRAWTRALGSGNRTTAARRAADMEWAGRFPERDDAPWVRLLGPGAPLDALLEHGPDEGTDASLAALAPQVWQPLLANRNET